MSDKIARHVFFMAFIQGTLIVREKKMMPFYALLLDRYFIFNNNVLMDAVARMWILKKYSVLLRDLPQNAACSVLNKIFVSRIKYNETTVHTIPFVASRYLI